MLQKITISFFANIDDSEEFLLKIHLFVHDTDTNKDKLIKDNVSYIMAEYEGITKLEIDKELI